MTGPNATLVALRAPSQEAGASFRFRRYLLPPPKEGSILLFLKKKKQKDFSHLMRRSGIFRIKGVKVFWFFFSKKNALA